MALKFLAVFDLPPADPVAYQLPFLGTAWPTTILLASYLIFVLKIGRIYMRNRQPYNLKNVLIAYNAFQVIYNGLMFLAICYHIVIAPKYDFRCMETTPLDHPFKNTERVLCYAYFINKVIDLLDTIFFVLRKSDKQITLLHVYHHALMIFSFYWIVRYYGVGAQFITMAILNTFVHVCMYFYYLKSALYTGINDSLWWKKYITLCQLIQFMLIWIQSVYIQIFNPECKFPKFLQLFIFAQATIFMYMFGNFYIKTYIKRKQPKQQ